MPSPSRPIRVLIVDDALTARRLVADALSADPEIEVVGTAPDGRQALGRVESLRPDLVTLDLEMPVLDGLATLAELRRRHPRLPVVIISSATRRGAAVTLEALWLGANDYVTKPSTANLAATIAAMREALLPRIRALCPQVRREEDVETGSGVGTSRTSRVPGVPKGAGDSGRVSVVVIGASTGGPNALASLLETLPGHLPAPVLIVQHMPPIFTTHLAEGLSARCDLQVVEALPNAPVAPGRAWLAPGDHHLTVRRDGAIGRLRLDRDPPENACRPSLDPLLRSVAQVYGDGVLAVVLTGMGQDGLKGCQRVREAGGAVLVQDRESSVVWGMPGAIARAGLADAAWPPAQLGAEIVRRVGHGGRRQQAAA